MIQQKQLAGGLLALGISIALQANVSAATDTPSTSWLMSEAEVAAHTAAMAKLEGAARDEYRNAQYEQLKQRAQVQGFKLPADPPWSKEAVNPSVAASSEDAAAARHAEMREKLKARREAMQQASEANLERLQEAANAQQQQVQADQQRLDQESSKPPAITEVPQVPVPATETAAAPPSLAAPSVTAAMPPPPPTPYPVATTEAPTHTSPAPMKAPVAMTAPQAPTPPTPPSPPTKAATNIAPVPRFAPVEQTAAPIPEPVPTQALAIEANQPPPEAALATDQPADAMTAYRENMRTRFDEFMQERQMQMEENARRQREQHEAAMEQNRALRANRGPYAPYPYPAAPPSYGPRYPAAYPGYRTPYWQQQ